MGSMILICLLLTVAVAKPTLIKPLHKHHQHSLKLSPFRWLERSDERRAARGLPVDSMIREARSKPSLPTGGDLWPVAIYWSFVEVGSPPQQFPVAIDSGSFTLDIPLKGCQGCTMKAPNNQFDPSASSSSHLHSCSLFSGCGSVGTCNHDKKYCEFSNTYETCVPTDPTQPCSITGPFYSDVVSWGGTTPVPITFGAIESQTSNFEQFQNIDGVCGMAGGASQQSVISQLATNSAIDGWIWSLCLKAGAVSNGTITVGGIDDRLHNGEIQYTPNVGNGFYSMQITGIQLNKSANVFLDEQQVIIDSGTNILLLPDESYTSMKKLMLDMCSTVNLHGICDVNSTETLFDNVCYNFTQAQIDMFPTITFQVTGIELEMTAAQYILFEYGVNFKAGESCLGISSTGAGGLFIVGDTLIERYLVVFDQTNQKIGWAPVSDQCGNIKA